jgi:hypothetical protein
VLCSLLLLPLPHRQMSCADAAARGAPMLVGLGLVLGWAVAGRGWAGRRRRYYWLVGRERGGGGRGRGL